LTPELELAELPPDELLAEPPESTLTQRSLKHERPALHVPFG